MKENKLWHFFLNVKTRIDFYLFQNLVLKIIETIINQETKKKQNRFQARNLKTELCKPIYII